MTTPIASRASMSFVSQQLGEGIIASVAEAQKAGAIGLDPLSPERLFGRAIADAIDAVERRGDILRRFLLPGPYDGDGHIPAGSNNECLSDDETERAVTLLYSHTVNCFKGQLAELLALRPCSALLAQWKTEGLVHGDAALVIGDAAKPSVGQRTAKGADFHVLTESGATTVLEAVAEVKSFHTSPVRLSRQLASHVSRAARGLRCVGRGGSLRACTPVVRIGGPLKIAISLSNWRLSRGYGFVKEDGRSFLHTDPLPPIPEDSVVQLDQNNWHIVLGWSQEALSAEAYGLTYWYMEQLGADIFEHVPSPWPEMSSEKAGANAATQSLYHAIRRSRTRSAEQRAIALYNAYGFGYSLGTSYKDKSGRRHMLWPADLREMLVSDSTKRELWIR